ncbi:Type I Iterative PKS [Gnomoniopsis sp. IMI 355080]|nr:Type I Iterative PKS [Gnomoniopsis sp. IMI 355080]
MMSAPHIFMFGDQTQNFTPELRKLLAIDNKPILTAFLEQAHYVIHAQANLWLPPQQRRQFKSASLEELLHNHYEEPARIYPSPKDTYIVGLCTGSLAAAAISCASSLSQLLPVALHTVQVALRLGLLANDLKDRLSLSEFDKTREWSAILVNTDEAAVVETLTQFNAQNDLPEVMRPWIAATAGSAITVSATPSVLARLMKANTALKIKPIPIFLPAHNPKLFSEADVDVIMETTLGKQWAQFTGHFPLVSGGTGRNIWGPNFATVLRVAVNDCILGPIRLDKVAEYLPSVLESRRSSCIIVTQVLAKVSRALETALEKIAGTATVRNINSNPTTPLLSTPKGKAKLAIVGMSGRFPEAPSPETFWELLYKGLDVVKEVPAKRWNWKTHVTTDGKGHNLAGCKWGCWLDYADQFDPRFFSISPKEAPQMDPAQRMALMTTYEALESAGFVADQTPSSGKDRVGVFHGVTSNDYLECNSGQFIDTYFITGGNRGFIPGRINFCFEFCGPSYTNDTACSSSLAAVHLACNSLWRGDCDTAVAGGTNMLINPDGHTGLDKGFFLSRTGNCKPFDDKADGYCRAEGVGTVIIKRLDDALADNDPILGVILGAATNHSAMSDSITRPHQGAQAENMKEVLRQAKLDPLDLSYVEMHGTGTQVGDAVEMQSVLDVFAPSETFRPEERPLHVGTVKANIGHGEGVSGVTSLIKVMLMMKHDLVPPHCGIKPGSKINRTFPDLEARNVHIAYKPTPWERGDTPRRCLINNFSAAGGNTALILEDAPVKGESVDQDPRSSHIVTVSGDVAVSLKNNIQRLIEHLSHSQVPINLPQLSWTTTARKRHHVHRVAVTGNTTASIVKALEAALEANDGSTRAKAKPRIVFAFTGQGSHYFGMGKQLFEAVPTFKTEIESLDRLCKALGFLSFMEIITNGQGDVNRLPPVVIQLATTALQMALANYLRLLGLEPSTVVGHSLGEYAALYVAGVLSATDTLYLVGTRAMLLQENCTRGSHAMLAVKMPVHQLQELLGQGDGLRYEIACINSPADTVISGEIEQMHVAAALIGKHGIRNSIVKTPFAFHSSQVEPILVPFIGTALSVTFMKPRIPVICPLTAEVCADAGVFSAQYLARHCREAVNMSGALQAATTAGVLGDGNTFTVEVGPQPAVCNMIQATLGTRVTALPVLQRERDVWGNLTKMLATLYRRGQPVDWTVYHEPFPAAHRVLELPAYAWDLKEYWIKYENDWCIYKPFFNNPDLDKTVSMGARDPADAKIAVDPQQPALLSIPSLPSTKPKTTTVQKMIREDVHEGGATLVYEMDLTREDATSVAGGHIVNNVPFTTPSVFADMALVLGNYLTNSLVPVEKRAAIVLDVGDMVAHKVLIPTGKGSQPVRVEMQVKWAVGEPYTPGTSKCRFYSVNKTGRETSLHGWCTLDFVPRPTPAQIDGLARELRPKMQRLLTGAEHGEILKYNRASGYRLMDSVAHFAPDYKLLDDMILDDAALEASCTINLSTVSSLGTFAAHPGHIDAITQIGGFCVNAQKALDLNNEVFITHGWASLQVFRAFRRDAVYQLFAHMAPEGDEFYSGDTIVFDGTDVVAFMKGVKFRKVSKKTHKAVMETIVSRRQKASGLPAQPGPARGLSTVPTKTSLPPVTVHVATTAPEDVILQEKPKGPFSQRIAVSQPTASQTSTQATRELPAASADPLTHKTVDDALRIVAEESGISLEELTDDTNFADIGVDSLLSMVIVSRFREELMLSLDPEFNLFVDCATVKLMREFVVKVTAAAIQDTTRSPVEEEMEAVPAPSAEGYYPVPAIEASGACQPSPAEGQSADKCADVASSESTAPTQQKSWVVVHEEADAEGGSATMSGVSSNLSSPRAEQLTTTVKYNNAESDSFLGIAEARHANSALVSAALAIICEESGVASVELTDDTNFADIGVDSLLSMVIASRLREELGLDLDAEFSLFDTCPTVADLKTFVAAQSGGADSITRSSSDGISSSDGSASITTPSSEASPCRPATSVILQGVPYGAATTRTLFLLPDGSGSASAYTNIPRVNANIALVGLNCPYVRDPQNMFCGPDSLVDAFTAEILRRQPSGPFHLGGWSCGGAFAFACAVVLVSRGHVVASLVIIDAPTPERIDHLPAEFYAHVGEMGLYGLDEPPACLVPHFIRTTQTMLGYRPMPLRTAEPPRVGILWATETVMQAAGAPDSLKGREHFLLQARKDFGPDGWERLIPGSSFVLERSAGANHFNMMHKEHAYRIRDLINRIIVMEHT